MGPGYLIIDEDPHPKNRKPLPSGSISNSIGSAAPTRPPTDGESSNSKKYKVSEWVMSATQQTGREAHGKNADRKEGKLPGGTTDIAQQAGHPTLSENLDSKERKAFGCSTPNANLDLKKRKRSDIRSTSDAPAEIAPNPGYYTWDSKIIQQPQRSRVAITGNQVYTPSIPNANQPAYFSQIVHRDHVNSMWPFSANRFPQKPIYYPMTAPLKDEYINMKCAELFLKIECYERALRGIEIDLSRLKSPCSINRKLSETAEGLIHAHPIRVLAKIEPERRKLFTIKPATTEILRELFNVRPDRTICQELDALNPGVRDLNFETLICSCHAFLLGRLAGQEYDEPVDFGGALEQTLATGLSFLAPTH
jgi:hypothetical protein